MSTIYTSRLVCLAIADICYLKVLSLVNRLQTVYHEVSSLFLGHVLYLPLATPSHCLSHCLSPPLSSYLCPSLSPSIYPSFLALYHPLSLTILLSLSLHYISLHYLPPCASTHLPPSIYITQSIHIRQSLHPVLHLPLYIPYTTIKTSPTYHPISISPRQYIHVMSSLFNTIFIFLVLSLRQSLFYDCTRVGVVYH